MSLIGIFLSSPYVTKPSFSIETWYGIVQSFRIVPYLPFASVFKVSLKVAEARAS